MALFLKIVCDLAKQQKFIKAGPVPGWVWLAGLGQCRLSNTDGFIPKLVVPTLIPGLSTAQSFKAAAKLVEVGLWDESVGGYVVHDYFDFNPSKAQLEELKRQDAERKRTGRADVSVRNPVGIQLDAPRGRADAPRAGAPSPSPSVIGVGVGTSEESARETTLAVVPSGALGSRQTLVNGRDQRSHGEHAYCGRLCVPYRLHDDFVKRLGGADAEDRLVAWYPTALAAHDGRQVGDDLWVFWRNEFARFAGTVTADGRPGRAERLLTAAQRVMARQEGA